MSNIFFTSDTHFGHRSIIKYCNRPFDCVEDMTEELILRWNEVVKKSDIIYHLGDFSFFNNSITSTIIQRLNGTKVLILGNHDNNLSRKNKDLWDLVSYFEIFRDNGRKVVLTHFPFESWDNGYHFHGHTHGKHHRSNTLKTNRLDVGVDCHGWYPIEFSEAIKICEKY